MSRPSIQQWAGFYQDGLRLKTVPLLPGQKATHTPNWTGLQFTPDDFAAGDNLGLKSADGIVVVDDDCVKKGFDLGEHFLPPTKAIYGRSSAPDSKRLYVCADLPKSKTWKDLKGDVLFELRVGVQDMAPPSIHPSGEQLRWKPGTLLYDGVIASVKADRLIAACNYRATAVLIAQHWPAEHGRRELLLAFARVLIETFDITDDTATEVLVSVAELGGLDSDGLSKARRAVASTRAALTDNKPALGAGHIRTTIPEGPALLRRLREWFGKTDALAEAIEKLNDQYFLVDVGTQTVVGEEITRSEANRSWTDFEFRPFEDLKKKLIKSTVQVGTNQKGEPIFKPLADVWLRHSAGRQYNRLVFAPQGSHARVGPNDLNGWKGFTVTPAPGDWSLTRDRLIRHVMCRDDEALFEWTLDWTAALVQQPGKHAETALVLTGAQGVGKNFFADALVWLFDGRHAKVTTKVNQVLGEFNDILSGMVLLVLDEVGLNTAADYNATKGLITGHTIDINRKGIRIATERSMLHVVFLSNDAVPLKVAADDRRFAFYHFADTHQNDITFFAAVMSELNAGGRAAMLHDLSAREVNWDRLRLAPNTSHKQNAKRESWTAAQWFFFRQLREIGPVLWPNHADKNGVQVRRLAKSETEEAFRCYLEQTKSRREVKDARSELHTELKKLVPPEFEFNRPVRERGVLSRDYWTLPDWTAFKESFGRAVGCDVEALLADDAALETQDQLFAGDADE